MPAQTLNIPIEAFVTDEAFINLTSPVNDLTVNQNTAVGVLNNRALTYFNVLSQYRDSRNPNTRDVNWAATSSPKLMVDGQVFQNFVSIINGLNTSINLGFFKIIDRLLFKYSSSQTLNQIETYLTTDTNTSAIYVPGSFSISTNTLTGTLFNVSGSPTTTVPVWASFTIAVLSGSTILNYDVRVFVGLKSFLEEYSFSTIAAVIPPLPYSDLYSDSLLVANTNQFSTANLTTSLNYSTSKAVLENSTITGVSKLTATLVDIANNRVDIQFNFLYKGQIPTQENMRDAARAAVLGSGIGTEEGWKIRIPSLFILGRYFIVPLWDQTYQKPDQLIYPNMYKLTTLKTIGNTIFESLGQGDISNNLQLINLFYNKIAAIVLPDPLAGDPVPDISTLFSDYQDYSTSEENFVYMEQNTKFFASRLNTLITQELTNDPTIQEPSQERILRFYTFEVAEYEMCIITKDNYLSILESSV